MKNIDSHIQPKFFLKGFLAKKEDANYDDFLYVYKKGMPFKTDGTRKENNPSKSGLNNTALVKNFYAFLKEDGTQDNETYEQKLEKDIENPANSVLEKLRNIKLPRNKLIKVRDLLSDDERIKFMRYIGAMYARSKSNRKKFDNIVIESSNATNNKGFSYAEIAHKLSIYQRNNFETYFKLMNPDFDEATQRFSVPDELVDKFIDKSLKDESFPKSIFRAVELLQPIISKMKWQIRISPPLNKFFTGDHPVYYTDLRHPKAELLFPISSNAIFCASNDQNLSENVFLETDYSFVVKVRKIFAENCNEIYFSSQAEWLVKFFNNN